MIDLIQLIWSIHQQYSNANALIVMENNEQVTQVLISPILRHGGMIRFYRNVRPKHDP